MFHCFCFLVVCIVLAFVQGQETVTNSQIYDAVIASRDSVLTELNYIQGMLGGHLTESNEQLQEIKFLLDQNAGNYSHFNFSFDILQLQLAGLNTSGDVMIALLEHIKGVATNASKITEYDQECFCVTPSTYQDTITEENGYAIPVRRINTSNSAICWVSTPDEGLRPRGSFRYDHRVKWIGATDAVSSGTSSSLPLTCQNGTRAASVFWDYWECDDAEQCNETLNGALRSRYVGNGQYRSFESSRPSLFSFTRDQVSLWDGSKRIELYQCRLNQWARTTAPKIVRALVALWKSGEYNSQNNPPAYDGTDAYSNTCPGYFGNSLRCDIAAKAYYGKCEVVWSDPSEPTTTSATTTTVTTTTTASTPNLFPFDVNADGAGNGIAGPATIDVVLHSTVPGIKVYRVTTDAFPALGDHSYFAKFLDAGPGYGIQIADATQFTSLKSVNGVRNLLDDLATFSSLTPCQIDADNYPPGDTEGFELIGDAPSTFNHQVALYTNPASPPPLYEEFFARVLVSCGTGL